MFVCKRWVLSFIRARIISGHFRARSLEKSDFWVWFKFALFCCLCRRCCSISVTECVGRTAWIQPFFMGSQNPNRSGIKVDWCINPGCQVIVALGKKFYWKLKVSPFFLYRDWETAGCRVGEGPPINELEDVYIEWTLVSNMKEQLLFSRVTQHKLIHDSEPKSLESGKLFLRKDREILEAMSTLQTGSCLWGFLILPMRPHPSRILGSLKMCKMVTKFHSSAAEHCTKLHTVPPSCLLPMMHHGDHVFSRHVTHTHPPNHPGNVEDPITFFYISVVQLWRSDSRCWCCQW